jgi:hypothetical protein
MADYEKVLGSNARPFLVDLIDDQGAPIDLGVGSSVRFRFKRYPSATPRLDVPGEVVDAVAGRVQYDWGATSGDFDSVDDIGLWRVDALVTFQDGTQDAFPAGGFWTVSVRRGEG